ncbi:MAG: TonB-dependent receptor [Acidobacteriota bacterium]
MMRRFYRDPKAALLALAMLTGASAAAGQMAPLPAQPLLGSTLDADRLRDLPTANNPFSLLETFQPETIGSLFAAGGLNIATAPTVGGFLNSWTQTQFRIGDITVTDPRAGGTPLLLPALPFWDRITTSTGAGGVDDNAAAVSMTIEPPRPGPRWVRAVEGLISAPGLVSNGPNAVPAVDQVRHTQDGSVLISGPLTTRLGVAAGGSWRGLSHLAAPAVSATRERLASGLAHLVFAATPRDEIRALGWAQRVTTPAATDHALHLQSTWERRDPAQLNWRVFGGYTQRTRSTATAPTLVVDSLLTGPVSDAFDSGAGTARRWVIGARVAPPATGFLPAIGIDLERAQVRVRPSGIAQIRELVDGTPARLWTIHSGPATATDDRHLTTLAAHANEHLAVGRLTLDLGLRLDTVTGAAAAAASGIQWTSWLPRAMARWRLTDTAGLALFAGYRRSAYQLPLNVLAIGDPAAPVADVSNWNGTAIGPLIARLGPGTGGDAALTRIDPQLRRPITDELVLGIESRPLRGLHVQFTRVTKREQPLLEFVNTGVPASTYTAFQVPDPDFLPYHRFGAPEATVYDRPPGSAGRDRYLLTNRTGDPARFWGVELTVRATTDRLTLLFGGNLTWALGPSAAVGFLPTENDQDVLGNLFVDPNAATRARGQLFQDRSHVLKLAGIYRLPGRIHVGVMARYQDGQPFARLLIVPGLTQGPTAVRAYANGGAAFTYTGTLDVRLQKVFAAGRSEVAAVVDVYNLPNLGKEVAEYVVSGPLFRTPTMRQPPRTALVGVRVGF